ncbi:MAG: hypothetical protein H6831_11760 [Planctomycetes bacterium]|nr:hypothetical protein [Planctomycetota bacterium]MCB9905076.1 hypothetical protein [Planctomycetota bacterium]
MEGLSLNISSTQGDQSLGRAKELAARLERAEADSGEKTKVAEEFSALLGTMLVKELRKSLPEGFFGQGPGSDIMDGWLDEHIGRSLSSGWDLDIAGMVKVGLEHTSEEGGAAR